MPRFPTPPWMMRIGLIVIAAFGAIVLTHDWLTRAGVQREALKRCQAETDAARCAAGVREHHVTCFNLAHDGGSRYRRGTGLKWGEYLPCVQQGPDAYRRSYADRLQRQRTQRDQ